MVYLFVKLKSKEIELHMALNRTWKYVTILYRATKGRTANFLEQPSSDIKEKIPRRGQGSTGQSRRCLFIHVAVFKKFRLSLTPNPNPQRNVSV
jgi:hypothetical protein